MWDRLLATAQIRHYISQTFASLVGCVLFIIGIIGIMGGNLYPVQSISFLARGTEQGAKFDQLYWAALILVGIWLILFVYARLAAGTAIILILTKGAILHDWISF